MSGRHRWWLTRVWLQAIYGHPIQGRLQPRLRHRHAGCHHSQAPRPFQAPKSYGAVWAVGGTVYALDSGWGWEAQHSGRFEMLCREPRRRSSQPDDVTSRVLRPDGSFSFDTRRRACALHGRWMLLPMSDEAHFVGALARSVSDIPSSARCSRPDQTGTPTGRTKRSQPAS